MDAPKPLFLFLHTVGEPAPMLTTGATPAAVAIDLDQRQASVFASPQGIGVRQAQSLATAAMFLGLGGTTQLFHTAPFRHLAETWPNVFAYTLGLLVSDTAQGFGLDSAAFAFFENDVFPDEALHERDSGFWTPQARVHRAGIFHTRDAAIWTGNTDAGFAAALCPKDFAGTLSPDGHTRDLLAKAAEAAGLDAPRGEALATALDRVLVGTVATVGSGHAALALRQRLGEDLALLPRIWRHTGATPRPVVPVFL
jgi:hypothetical protein